MRRLVYVSADYTCMLGGRYITYGITHERCVVFSCGRTQHVGRMCSSIVSVIHSVLVPRTTWFFVCRVILHSHFALEQQLYVG